MWKIESWRFGVLGPALGLMLGSATALGQEKPKVGEDLLTGDIWIVESHDRRVWRTVPGGSQPMMEGELKGTVEKLEAAVAVVEKNVETDSSRGLAALESVTKAAMKARRLLMVLDQSDKDPSGDSDAEPVTFSVNGVTMMVWSPNGDKLIPRAENGILVDRRGLTPLQEAQENLALAVNKLRFSTDVKAARASLDELDRSVPTLRQLLWKKKRG